EQERQLRDSQDRRVEQMRHLMGLKAVGPRTAWILVMELFSWRAIKNGKELGALVGLTPVPYDSGKSQREQGISKAGNKHVRSLMVELAWLWLRWQPKSRLSQWYERRCGAGNKRARKVGMGALARLAPGVSRELKGWIGEPYLSGLGRYRVALRYSNEPQLEWSGLPLGEHDPKAWEAVRRSTP